MQGALNSVASNDDTASMSSRRGKAYAEHTLSTTHTARLRLRIRNERHACSPDSRIPYAPV